MSEEFESSSILEGIVSKSSEVSNDGIGLYGQPKITKTYPNVLLVNNDLLGTSLM